MGEVALADGSNSLSASGVGSCLVITLYDAVRRVGALAHAVLPRVPDARGALPRDTKYVTSAIDEMLNLLSARGAKRQRIEAKIIGGANMFRSAGPDIGAENVEVARMKLADEGIVLVAECVGGSSGRSVEFCTATGIVMVKIKV